jgi:hypothetical protein
MSGAPTAPRLPMVGFAIEGKKSGTGQCPVCTGLSGAPPDRKKVLPSKWDSNSPRPLGSIKGTPRRLQVVNKCSQQV